MMFNKLLLGLTIPPFPGFSTPRDRRPNISTNNNHSLPKNSSIDQTSS